MRLVGQRSVAVLNLPETSDRPGDYWQPAATLITKRVRGHLHRAQFLKMVKAGTTIAAHARGSQQKKTYARKRAAAVRIQREWSIKKEQRMAEVQDRRVRRHDRELALGLVKVAQRAFRTFDERALHRLVTYDFEYHLELNHGMGCHTHGIREYMSNTFLARQAPLLQKRGKIFVPLKALSSTCVTCEISMASMEVFVEYTIRPASECDGETPRISRVRMTPRHGFGTSSAKKGDDEVADRRPPELDWGDDGDGRRVHRYAHEPPTCALCAYSPDPRCPCWP